MSEQKVYARVVDGKVVEYPVAPIHITNRAHPLSWYTEVVFDTRPEEKEFFTVQEEVKVVGGRVTVSFKQVPQSLDAVLARINNPSNAIPADGEELPAVAFGDVAPEAVQRVIELAREMVQKRLDDFAREKNYDGILSVASYATSKNSVFAVEGQKAVDARDESWLALYTYLGKVQGGVLPVPKTSADIEAVLPALSWE